MANRLWNTEEAAAAAPRTIRPYLQPDLRRRLDDVPHRLLIFQAAQMSLEHRRVKEGVQRGVFAGVTYDHRWKGRFHVRFGEKHVVMASTAAEAARMRDIRVLERRGVYDPPATLPTPALLKEMLSLAVSPCTIHRAWPCSCLSCPRVPGSSRLPTCRATRHYESNKAFQ